MLVLIVVLGQFSSDYNCPAKEDVAVSRLGLLAIRAPDAPTMIHGLLPCPLPLIRGELQFAIKTRR